MIGINFGRGVKKNPKTIFIYTPIKSKRTKAISGQQNMNGKEEKERSESGTVEIIEGISYKRVAVYDIGDTYIKKENKRIPILDDNLDSNNTEQLYNMLLEISPVPVLTEEINEIKKGYFSKKEQKIVLKKVYHKMIKQQF